MRQNCNEDVIICFGDLQNNVRQHQKKL